MAHSAPSQSPPLRVALETLGCKLNLADSDLLARDFAKAGFIVVTPDAPSDIYVVNTCTVTHVADRKARQRLRAAKRRNPASYVIATGCYPERSSKDLLAMPEVDLVLGNTDKPRLVAQVQEALQERQFLSSLPLVEDDLPPRPTAAASRVRTFLKIQEGCNDYCSYCIIPKTRGVSRFFPPERIIADINERAASGFQEVVLTGTQLGDFGIELTGPRRMGPDQRDQATEGNPLADLLQRILDETTIPRIRVSSLQPQDMTAELLEQWQDPRLCRHFHLPLQSGADPVLHAMRRRYTARQYEEAVERIRIRYPDASITTDVLVGFPGETDDDFETTYRRCEALGYADMHVFPYSPRPSTLAARLPAQVADPAKEARLQRLLHLSAASRERFLAHAVGTSRPVLWEEAAPALDGASATLRGLTDTYLHATAAGSPELVGTIQTISFVRATSQDLWGELFA